ncbi:MAG: EAL domain-containing protein [Magnetospirillum sp.]|nr:EAL domain-containing protein [Magnetospirillum sp.]
MTFARSRLALLIGILTVACASVVVAVVLVLYGVFFDSQEQRLAEVARAHVRMVEAIGRKAQADQPAGGDWRGAALGRIADALGRTGSLGESGEFAVGVREGDDIVFYPGRHEDEDDSPVTVSLHSPRAEAMRRALMGSAGVMVTPDYRGVPVLAAYAPISDLGFGLEAKIDMEELRRPFLRAVFVAALVGLMVVTAGALMFARITQPMLRRLYVSERRHRTLFQEMRDAAAVLTPVDDGRDFVYLDFNPSAQRLEGLRYEEVIGEKFTRIFPGAANHGILAVLQRVHASGEAERLPIAFYQDERISGWREHTFYRLPSGEVVHIWDEVTGKKRTEASLQMASSVFNHTGEGILVTSPQGVIERVNPAFIAITGYSAEEVVGRTPAVLKSDHQDPEFYRRMWQTLREQGRWQGEIWNRRKNGEAYLEWLTITAVLDEAGAVSHYVGVFNDISELHEKDLRIRHQAHHDALTGLPNRILLLDRLDQAIAASSRGEKKIALLFLDLDRFKVVNDSLGHDVGDDLLKEVAYRLSTRVSEADTVARLGGDEFVIVHTGWNGLGDVASLAEKILSLLETPFTVAERDLHVGGSIGIALHPADGASARDLLKNADTAMHAVKQADRNAYRFFDASMNKEAMERLTLENDLRRAIDRGELEVYYQPKFALADGRMVGAEALVRWHHPMNGMVSPGRFIPLAEDTGLVVPLGEWVLRQVCRQVAAWHAAGLDCGPVAVNVSARQLVQPDFASQVASILGEEGVEPDMIDLEITETAIMRDPDRAAAILASLSIFGTRVVLDDFGVGHSSLGYLKRLPISVLKMDRTFIRDVTDDSDAAALARGIIDLARQLGIEVVAEGVETEAQATFLKGNGCALVQGYLFAKPMPAGELERRLSAPALMPV